MTHPSTLPGMPVAPAAGALAAAAGRGDDALLAALTEALGAAGIGVAVKDAISGRYHQANARLAQLLGVESQRLEACTDADLFEAGQAAALRSADQSVLGGDEASVCEHKLDVGGQRRELSVVRMPIAPAPDEPDRLIAMLWTDLAPQRQREAALQQALDQLEQQQQAAEALLRESQDRALRDGVTGLYQRAHFEDQLRREVDLSSREHREFSLVAIAIDTPADEVRLPGGAALNRIHEALGRLLRGNTRAMDASCRLDDERFAVLLSGVGLATAHSRMEQLRRQCATQIVVLDGKELRFTVSMGVASFPHTAQQQEALVAAAEAALGEARRRGGNHVALASIRFEPA